MKTAKVLNFPKPRTFTTNEAFIERVREEMFASKKTWAQLAEASNVSVSTVANLASGKTRWPRPTTLFPLFEALRLELRISRRKPE